MLGRVGNAWKELVKQFCSSQAQ